MLKIDSIKYDLCTKGPAISHPTIIVEFSPTDIDSGVDIFEEFKKKIESEGLTDAYSEGLSYKQNVYFLFKGRIFQKENLDEYRKVFNGISKEAADIQKALMNAHTINVGQLKPPFFMWEGIPQDFTGVDSAYNDFNVPYVVLDSKSEYSPVALQQVMNHPFGTVFVRWDGLGEAEELWNEINEMFHGFKCFLIADSLHWSSAKKFALDHGCCLYPELKN